MTRTIPQARRAPEAAAQAAPVDVALHRIAHELAPRLDTLGRAVTGVRGEVA